MWVAYAVGGKGGDQRRASSLLPRAACVRLVAHAARHSVLVRPDDDHFAVGWFYIAVIGFREDAAFSLKIECEAAPRRAGIFTHIASAVRRHRSGNNKLACRRASARRGSFRGTGRRLHLQQLVRARKELRKALLSCSHGRRAWTQPPGRARIFNGDARAAMSPDELVVRTG
jgi:hypothetical protein